MGDQYRPLAKRDKLRQDLFDHRLVHDHTVMNVRQFFDLVRNRNVGIHKFRKTPGDLPILDPDRADLNDAVRNRGKARRLQIKDHIRAV